MRKEMRDAQSEESASVSPPGGKTAVPMSMYIQTAVAFKYNKHCLFACKKRFETFLQVQLLAITGVCWRTYKR